MHGSVKGVSGDWHSYFDSKIGSLLDLDVASLHGRRHAFQFGGDLLGEGRGRFAAGGAGAYGLQLGLHLNELATDSRWLRIYGARHRATVGLSTSFAGDGLLNVQGNFYHYHTRTDQEIGAGGNLDLELGYRIRRVRPLWTVRASGSYTRNFLLTDKSPEFGAGSTSASELINTLPLEFAAAGVGTRVEHRFPGVAPIGPGRWRYFADAWVGWLWPVNLVGFEMSAGVTLALPRRQEVSLKGFVANNRWLGPGVLNAGVSLSYTFR